MSSKINLLFIEYKYFDYGRGNWDRQLMERIDKKNIQMYVLTTKFPSSHNIEKEKLQSQGIIFYFLSENKFFFILSSVIMISFLSLKKKTIIYTPSIRLIPLYLITKLLYKNKIIFSLQGAAIKELNIMEEFKNIRSKKYLFLLKKFFVYLEELISGLSSDIIIVISKEIEKELLKIGIDKNKIYLIYYAINTRSFRYNTNHRKVIREKFNINKDTIVFLYVGRVSYKSPSKLWSIKMLINL